MAKILDMPKLSPTMEEGVLSAWHKKEGDAVDVDDLLAEVETDKATMEFRAFDKGTLLKTLVAAGANVKLGQPVAILGAQGEDIAPLLAKTGAAPSGQAPAAALAPAAPPTATTANPTATANPIATASPTETLPPPAVRHFVTSGNPLDRTEREPAQPARAEGRVLASPYVRKVARDLGVDLQGAQGSGPHGRIVASDVEALKSDGGAALARTLEPATLTNAAIVRSAPGLAYP